MEAFCSGRSQKSFSAGVTCRLTEVIAGSLRGPQSPTRRRRTVSRCPLPAWRQCSLSALLFIFCDRKDSAKTHFPQIGRDVSEPGLPKEARSRHAGGPVSCWVSWPEAGRLWDLLGPAIRHPWPFSWGPREIKCIPCGAMRSGSLAYVLLGTDVVYAINA